MMPSPVVRTRVLFRAFPPLLAAAFVVIPGCGGGASGEPGGLGGEAAVSDLDGTFIVACDYPTGLNPAAPVHSCVDHYAKDRSDALLEGLEISCTSGGGTPRDDLCPDAGKSGACLVEQAGTSDSFGLFSLQWLYEPTTTEEVREMCENGEESFVRPDGTIEVREEPGLGSPGPKDDFDDLDTLCSENEVPGPNLEGAEVVFTIETEAGVRRVAGRVAGTDRDELEFRAQCIPTGMPGGYGISFSLKTRADLMVGAYDSATPGEDEVVAVNGSYIHIVALADSSAASDPDAYQDVWQGTSFSASRPGYTEDFEFEITSIAPLAQTSTYFKIEAHGWAQIAMSPTLNSSEPDPSRQPATIRVDF